MSSAWWDVVYLKLSVTNGLVTGKEEAWMREEGKNEKRGRSESRGGRMSEPHWTQVQPLRVLPFRTSAFVFAILIHTLWVETFALFGCHHGKTNTTVTTVRRTPTALLILPSSLDTCNLSLTLFFLLCQSRSLFLLFCDNIPFCIVVNISPIKLKV